MDRILIDTHCHLNDPAFEPTLPDVVERARGAGVHGFIVPAYDRVSLKRTADLASLYPGAILPAYGVHPWYAGDNINYDILLSYLRRQNTVALGEIGLDFTPDAPSEPAQIAILTRQLDLARELNLPVLLHCRNAHDALYQMLKAYWGGVQGVMHSFSGNYEFMQRFIDLGFFISFSGSVTRKKAKKYHRNAQAVPSDRLLIETDAPSIATESTVASAVEPRHCVEVARKIAELRDIPFEEVCTLTAENAKRLFRLP
ncbi:MAG: putative deoxyribonuclease YjjV [Syntrophorhabdus sp. PtaU1.Bin002]|nr:MAG: putative deoxyribonuclease YjjV [Syntrophorhabdus sp. PtaB.Bin006]OPY72777.1 MAG: putative deoxyribonuclease YjjV [Syntrophorhabdus sp. PtaU1.Bin002]